MSPTDYAALLLVLLGFAAVTGVVAWHTPARRIWAPVTLVLLLAAGAVAAIPSLVDVADGWPVFLLVVFAGVLATAGGGPVTALVFDLVDRREPPAESLDHAGRILRGGAWIGALERLAIYAALVAGWPEGLAVVLVVKGFGRYPELRAAEDGVRTGAAERFIIGTFASVLWACGCAGAVLLIR
jgi:hypothetical protein